MCMEPVGLGAIRVTFAPSLKTAFGKALFEGFDRVGVGDVRKNKGGKLLKIIGVRHIVLSFPNSENVIL